MSIHPIKLKGLSDDAPDHEFSLYQLERRQLSNRCSVILYNIVVERSDRCELLRWDVGGASACERFS